MFAFLSVVLGRLIGTVVTGAGTVAALVLNPFEILRIMITELFTWFMNTVLTPFRVLFAVAFFAVILHYLFVWVLSIPIITEGAQSWRQLAGDYLPLFQYAFYLLAIDIWLPVVISFFFVRAVIQRLTIPLH